MQFLAANGVLTCPVCDSTLTLIREYDSRLALVRHESRTTCPFYWKQYHADRLTGYSEDFNAQKPTEVQVPSRGISPSGPLGQG